MSHFRIAASVVYDRSVGIGRQLDGNRAKHAERGHGDAVQTGRGVGGEDRTANDDDGKRGAYGGPGPFNGAPSEIVEGRAPPTAP